MWPEIEVMAAVEILHPVNAMSEEVLPRQLNTLREMIDFLILRHVLEETIFHRLGCPKEEPVVLRRFHLVGHIR